MPPIRTPTMKPVKTERTHEENQERAYIAASRRSDRSLEARIESARRASEIHKKRTGRALRVTEQDVVNEEMYEEEDDDLPAQYRRLQSHLQTGSWEFNRRLQAYMATQMGTRNALMEGSGFGPYPNAPFFTNQFGQPQPPTMMNPQMLHFNQGYRQAPYPMSPQGFPGMHHRSASISTPQELAQYTQNYPASSATTHVSSEQQQQRRMSLPPQPQQVQDAMRPPVSRTTSTASVSNGATSSQGATAGSPHGQTSPTTSVPVSDAGMTFPRGAPAMFGSASNPMSNTFAPFSTSLPAETQQLLSQPASMDNPNSYNPYWFTGNIPGFSYSYKPNSGSGSNSPGSKPGTSMEQTLSLNPLDTSVASAASDGGPTPFSGTLSSYNFGSEQFFTEGVKQPSSSGQNSGVVTPGGADWTNFLEPFEDSSGSQ